MTPAHHLPDYRYGAVLPLANTVALFTENQRDACKFSGRAARPLCAM
jgi:hypothetical protein